MRADTLPCPSRGPDKRREEGRGAWALGFRPLSPDDDDEDDDDDDDFSTPPFRVDMESKNLAMTSRP